MALNKLKIFLRNNAASGFTNITVAPPQGITEAQWNEQQIEIANAIEALEQNYSALSALLQSDDPALDNIQEIVDKVKEVATFIATIDTNGELTAAMDAAVGGTWWRTDFQGGQGIVKNGNNFDLEGFAVLKQGVGFGLTNENAGTTVNTPSFALYKDGTFDYCTFGAADNSKTIIYDKNGALVGTPGIFIFGGTDGIRYESSPNSIQDTTLLDKKSADDLYLPLVFASKTITASAAPGTGLIFNDLRNGIGGNNKTGIRLIGFGEASENDATGANYDSLVGTSLVPKQFVIDLVAPILLALQSDDAALDSFQEIVDALKQAQQFIATIDTNGELTAAMDAAVGGTWWRTDFANTLLKLSPENGESLNFPLTNNNGEFIIEFKLADFVESFYDQVNIGNKKTEGVYFQFDGNNLFFVDPRTGPNKVGPQLQGTIEDFQFADNSFIPKIWAVNKFVQKGLANKTGSTITFERGAKYGYPTAITGDLVFDFSAAEEGETIIMRHNASAEPALPAQAVLLGGEYVPNENNYIYLTPIKVSESPDVWEVHITYNQKLN